MPLQNVIMLQIGEGYEFFSTPSALYGVHTAEELGITRESLNNYFSRQGDKPVKIYTNDKCKIVKGMLTCGKR